MTIHVYVPKMMNELVSNIFTVFPMNKSGNKLCMTL